MQEPDRVVLDTNVLISAALSSLGKPFASLAWVRRNAYLSRRDHGEELFHASRTSPAVGVPRPGRVAEFLAALSEEAKIVEVTGQLKVCRDPDH